jgi:G3E family GTPase
MARILVTVITGFLGSGKTTLLNALLKHPEMSKAAVIVNEFGEIGIDYDLVEQSNENIIQLENGCLCCTVKGDLIDTFRDLYLQRKGGTVPWFDRVVIETTGIADPGPVLQIVLADPLVNTGYQLDGVVTTVDAINGEHSLDQFYESVKQVAVADRIIISKTDLPEGKNNLGKIRERLRSLNPAAPFIEKSAGNLDPSELFGGGIINPETRMEDIGAWLNPEEYQETQPSEPRAEVDKGQAVEYYESHGHKPSEHHAHDPLIQSFCIQRDEPMTMDTLRLFFDAMALEAGPDLLRVKGIINIADRPDHPAVIQGAQKVMHSIEWLEKWPTDDRRTRIVFITRGIDRAHIEDNLALIERLAERTAQAAGNAV